MRQSDYQVRQGDVLLLRVAALPEGRAKQADGGLCILARGETTGHCHYMPALEAVLLEANEAMHALAHDYGVQEERLVSAGLRVTAGTATLWHGTPVLDQAGPRDADHRPLLLPAGDYLVLTPMEYDDAGEFRRVAD